MEGILITVIINVALVAFGFGKLWQKSNDTSRRLDRIEGLLNGSPSASTSHKAKDE